jgi:hypothetical protein
MEENKQVVAEWKATNQERLSEIKSFNPELYSAINLALNYLNKSLTGEELIQEVEEVEAEPVEQQTLEENWRFKTLEEIQKEGLGFAGLSEKTISQYTGKPLSDLDLKYPVDLTIKKIKNRELNVVSGYNFDYKFFTNQPLPGEATSGYSLPIETIPSKLSFWLNFKSNKGDRQSPTQSAGDLYANYKNHPFTKEELFNTFFKGNDGNWWNLQEVKGTWRWEKSSPQPKVSSSSTSTTPEPIVEKSGWRIKTKTELEKDKLGDYGISPTALNDMYGKPLENLFRTQEQLKDAIKTLERPLFNSIRFTKGTAAGYELTKGYFTKQPIIEEQWRFKTLDEIDADGLDYAGLDKRDISKYTGKPLTELNLRYPVEEIVKDIKNNISVNVDGYTFRSKYFTTKPLAPQQIQKEEPVKKEWQPQDLVGKTLLFMSSKQEFLVEKFIRNNPKNKEYKLRNLTSPNAPEITYKISMNIVKKWLDGEVAVGVSIVEEQPTSNDYSTWTQKQLIAKRKEISDALIVFEEEDPEYKELKDQLDIIDFFID